MYIGDNGECVYFGNLWDGKGLANGFGRFFSCGDDSLAMRELIDEGMNVGGLDNFKEFV